jgi:hypothetical protein
MHTIYSRWYKQIFRTTDHISGTFQAIISILIQVGLEHSIEVSSGEISSLYVLSANFVYVDPADRIYVTKAAVEF